MKKRTIAAWMVLAVAMLAGLEWSPSVRAEIPQAGATDTKAPAPDAKAAPAMLDQLILASGTTVMGTIVEETTEEVKMLVQLGTIKATKPTTYKKADIVEIKRGVKPDDAPKAATTTSSSSSKSKTKKTKDKIDDLRAETGDESGALLYVAEMKGNFGQDVSETPLRELFEDVDRVFNDITTENGESVVKSEFRTSHVVIFKLNNEESPGRGFDEIFRAEGLAPIVENQIKRGRRVVFWIENAINGAALFPWISPEMYFTTDGQMAFTSDLEKFSIGDKMVDEKQISLRMGHAEGFAIKGGYDPILIKPMARSRYWLAVKFEGGKPVYLQKKPGPEDGDGWTILTDDGQGENKDKKARGANDLLSFDQEWAQKLGISKGTVDTIDDLAFALQFDRNYKVVESKADDIMGGWRDEVDKFQEMAGQGQGGRRPGRLLMDYRSIQVEGNYDDRTKARGRQLQLLKQIRSLLIRYKEFADIDGEQVAQIDVRINQIQQEQGLDQRQTRGTGSTGGNGGGGGGGGRPGG